jgi:hypothetical protein
MQRLRRAFAVVAVFALALMLGSGVASVQPAEARHREYPKEALEFLPREILDKLPDLVTQFLTPDDYKALHARCPGPAVEDVLHCVGE